MYRPPTWMRRIYFMFRKIYDVRFVYLLSNDFLLLILIPLSPENGLVAFFDVVGGVDVFDVDDDVGVDVEGVDVGVDDDVGVDVEGVDVGVDVEGVDVGVDDDVGVGVSSSDSSASSASLNNASKSIVS